MHPGRADAGRLRQGTGGACRTRRHCDRSDSAGGGSYSQTNTQEVGVDEADLVETDGQYLYMLSGGKLVIIDARTDQFNVVSETTIDVRSPLAACSTAVRPLITTLPRPVV